jgi:ABC-type nitrate/sulfonate/bicarbonate transport system ATPase subunit
VIFITHDLQEAARLAHRIYFMHGHPANIQLAATLDEPIPRELTGSTVLNTQNMLYPLWTHMP